MGATKQPEGAACDCSAKSGAESLCHPPAYSETLHCNSQLLQLTHSKGANQQQRLPRTTYLYNREHPLPSGGALAWPPVPRAPPSSVRAIRRLLRVNEAPQLKLHSAGGLLPPQPLKLDWRIINVDVESTS